VGAGNGAGAGKRRRRLVVSGDELRWTQGKFPDTGRRRGRLKSRIVTVVGSRRRDNGHQADDKDGETGDSEIECVGGREEEEEKEEEDGLRISPGRVWENRRREEGDGRQAVSW
jgi:hypothetical protein